MPRELKDIKDLSFDDLVSWMDAQGLAAYRADQVFKWIYRRQADTFTEMTNLGKPLRELLARTFEIGRLVVVATEDSRDGSRKFLMRLKDNCHIECVLIPEKAHDTLCISSQVGCAQGCHFCMTARGGLVRNLTSGEIIAQVRDVMGHMPDRHLTNIVMMGMGEPLANYRAVVKAIDIITNADHGLGISTRRFTLSTAGVAPRLADLGRDTDINLAISLNAADDITRSRLMPINRKYKLADLLAACAAYPLKRRRRITFEYILIKGINDSPEDAERLSALLAPLRAKINLIPFNEHPESKFKRPDQDRVQQFQDILVKRNFTAIVRHSKGQDISAACGQLRGKLRDGEGT
jgi:23S rRNA (adenine2503-C2)-methyltransferase